MADAINYDNGERGKNGRALNKISAGYDEIAAERGEETAETPTMIGQIKARHEAGASLSTMEKMLLGTYEADVKRQAKLQARKETEE